MIILSGKCKYRKLLDRHCPSKVASFTFLSSMQLTLVARSRTIGSATKIAASSLSVHFLLPRYEADRVVSQELMSEPRTQCSKADISIEVSHRSLVEPHGETDAAERARAKPRFADYLCTPYQVRSHWR